MELDQAGAVRPEDAFDAVAVDTWLRTQPGFAALRGTPQVTQFGGGASNLTYRLRYPDDDLVLRRPPAGRKVTKAHDMVREYEVQRQLKPVFGYVPTVRALCRDHDVLGADFYVMDRIPGSILRGRLPAGVTLSPRQATTLCEAAVDTLADLHAVDPHAAGLDGIGRGPGYVARQVAGWTDRYAGARTWNVPSFDRVTGWLRDNAPDDVAQCVVHNDYRLDNLVLDPGDLRVVGVLDWELATIGDPLLDLGSSLAYWVETDDGRIAQLGRRQPSHLPGMLTRREIVERYAERTGRDVANWRFYEVFGLFRLAVIAQQLYHRYHHKQTTNPAFRHYWFMVRYLDLRCRRSIRRA